MGKRLNKLIFRKVRDANLKYHLVEDGDRIAAAMSGGKDSLTMLYFLDLLRRFTPLKFDIVPVYIDLGWQNETAPLFDFCQQLGYNLVTEYTNIGRVVFDLRQEKNPCALCSNLRRGCMSRVARAHRCNKVALGHHLDDVVHTLFMSILYESRYKVFKPSTYLDRSDITLIRPLIYVKESEIINFVDSMGLKPVFNRCPADGSSKRSEVQQTLDLIEQRHPGARQSFLSALENVDRESLWVD
ncbi:MAG: ATP-binding protein [Syntrophomonas sp.]